MLNIPLRVKNLVKKYDTHNPYSLARDLNISICILDLPMSIRGFFIRPKRQKFIVINSRLSEAEQLVAICHELGHARLHKGYGMLMKKDFPYYRSSQKEAEANEFAAYLLSYSAEIDTKVLQQVIRQKRPDPKFIHQILTEIIGNV